MKTASQFDRWLFTTNHRDVGVLYLVTSLAFFLVGGMLAETMRTQLSAPGNTLVNADAYDQLVTMHGVVMVLFFLSPLGFAFANYILPLQIGARDLAFPRMNAFSYWLYLFGGMVALSGFATGGAAAAGWTFYSPLTSARYSPGTGIDLAGAGLLLLAISVTASTVNFIVTVIRMRAPGLKLPNMPMFSWSVLFTVLMMLFAFPALIGGLAMLVADRHFGTLFFSTEHTGALLWTNIFWFFGHPEVYIVLFPAFGAIAEILPVFTGRPIHGRKLLIWAWGAVVVMSFTVWMHHMFTTGIDLNMRKFMSFTTILISLPFDVIVLAFIASLAGGRIRFATPMLFVLGSIALFIIGGVTGVFLSSVALDYNLRGGYWVVAHFHFTMVGASVLGLMGGLYYWFPLITGRMYGERLGKVHFYGTFSGFLLTFMPQFFLFDMPRRVFTYDVAGWALPNLLSTAGAFLLGLSQLPFLYNIAWNWRRGPKAGRNPWKGTTPEWGAPGVPQASVEESE